MLSADDFVARASALSEAVNVPPGPDHQKAHCDAMVAAMREAELFAVSVPARLGGADLGVRDIAHITHEIATQSGSAGLLYAMHMSQALSLTTHAAGPWFDALMKRMLAEQMVIASGTSEKGPGGDILTSICETETLDDGRLRVVKESPNISYIDHADLILVTANHRMGKRRKQVLIAAEVDRERFESVRTLSLMGMNGLLNAPWRFTVECPEDAVFAADFGAVARQTMTPSIQIFWAALWSGIVHGILDKTRRFVTEVTDPATPAGALAARDLTQLVERHHIMNTVIRNAIQAFEARGAATDMGFGLSAAINRVKTVCSEEAVAIAMGALALTGIRGYATGGPYSLAEPIADLMSGPIMVSNTRLRLNTAQIERFVEERLFPTPAYDAAEAPTAVRA